MAKYTKATKDEKREVLQSELGHLAVCDNLVQEMLDDNILPNEDLPPLTSDDVVAMETATEEEQTKMARSRRVVYNIWICHHCHHKNVFIFNSVERIRSTLREWTSEQRRLDDIDVEMQHLDTKIVVCNECLRYKLPVSLNQLHNEQVASLLFMLIVAFPLALLLIFPACLYTAYDVVHKSFERDAVLRDGQQAKRTLGGKQMVENQKQVYTREKANLDWVIPRFSHADPNSSDVMRYLTMKHG